MKLIQLLLLLAFFILIPGVVAKPAKVVFISGKPSHGPNLHEHRAGNLLLANRLNESGLDVEGIVLSDVGYPQNVGVLDDAATVVLFCTGHKGHLLNPHLETFDALMDKGVGVVMIHWATEATKGEAGDKFLSWMGGFCDLDWSVNPHWTPHFSDFPDHPIANGVEPFTLYDEWYYHMRFVEDTKGLTSILAAVAPPDTLSRPDGPRWGNPHVRASVAAGEKQTVGWAYERPNGGRGLGFTGGHYHKSWQDDNFRKVVLNAILWTAQVEVPEEGLDSKTPTDQDLLQNLDNKENWKARQR